MNRSAIHMWDTYEVTMYAEKNYDNPYKDVIVWADLKGPDFDKRVYGFWDGENVFKIRMTADKAGIWTWKTGANVSDEGLVGKCGTYLAYDWTEEEKKQNPSRRGIIRASKQGHTFEYADGTPFVMVGDTWWALATYRYPWVDDEIERTGPDMTMKDMARIRKAQGFNTVGVITTFPTWASDDGELSFVYKDDEHNTCIRQGWSIGTQKERHTNVKVTKDMHNEGGRPFMFPGKVPGFEHIAPDFDRINPEYFKVLDKKINWLNDIGITVFIETLRRDVSKILKYYHEWPMVMVRFVQYLFARYQTNNCLFSPVHYDADIAAIDSREFNEAFNLYIDMFGKPPFGTLLGTNPPGSTKVAYGGPEEQHWKTFDQTGNFREHEYYWLLTDIFNDDNPCPAINGEPYYAAHLYSHVVRRDDGVTEVWGTEDPTSETDQLNCRSGWYGSALSGAYGGILAGFDGMWNCNVQDDEFPFKMWEACTFPSCYQTRYFADFLLSEGAKYRDLIPNSEWITPNKTGSRYGYRGWAYCSRTKDRSLILGYAEKDCLKLSLRALRPYDLYEFTWFNPRTGEWIAHDQQMQVDTMGQITLPEMPDDLDWAFKLKKINDDLRVAPSGKPIAFFGKKRIFMDTQESGELNFL